MDDDNFIVKAASFLAMCSPGQRTQLVKMAENFGKSGDKPDSSAMDAALRADPEAGKSLLERFPGLKRLHG